jgi:hypothetical protein
MRFKFLTLTLGLPALAELGKSGRRETANFFSRNRKRASIKTKCTHAGLTGAEAAKFIAGKGLDAKMNKPPESWLGWFRDARYEQITREEQDRQFLERNLKRDS